MLNWAIGIDMYTLMCIKLMPNKNLQYKKTNKTTNTKIKKKKKKHIMKNKILYTFIKNLLSLFIIYSMSLPEQGTGGMDI